MNIHKIMLAVLGVFAMAVTSMSILQVETAEAQTPERVNPEQVLGAGDVRLYNSLPPRHSKSHRIRDRAATSSRSAIRSVARNNRRGLRRRSASAGRVCCESGEGESGCSDASHAKRNA